MNGSSSFPKISPHLASESFKKKREKNMFQQLPQSFGSLCTGETHCSSLKCIDVHLVLKRQSIQEYFLWTKAIMNCTDDVGEFLCWGHNHVENHFNFNIICSQIFQPFLPLLSYINGMMCIKHSEMFLLILYSFPVDSL